MTEERKESLPDEEFEAYLEGRSEVSHGYRRLRDVEPPPELDRAVLREARAAVEPPARERAFPAGWLPRVAVAATLLVAVGVALQFGDGPVEGFLTEDSIMTDAPVPRSSMPESPPRETTSGAPRPDTLSERPIVRSRQTRERRVDLAPPSASVEAGSPSLAVGPLTHRAARGQSGQLAPGEDEADIGAVDSGAREQAPVGGQFADDTRLEEDTFETYEVLPQLDVTGDSAWSEELESALRHRLGGDVAATDEAGRDRIEDRVLELLTYLEARSTRINALLIKIPSNVEPPPRDDWIALIDAQLDVGYGMDAWRELQRFVATYPDYPLDERQLGVLHGKGVMPSR